MLSREIESSSGRNGREAPGNTIAPERSNDRLICGATRRASVASIRPRTSGAKPDLELERSGAQLRRAAARADLDIAQLDDRGRQDARVDRSDAHAQSGEPSDLVFECGAVVVPVDNKRRNQRGNERQDHRDSQSEQRRLHGVSSGP